MDIGFPLLLAVSSPAPSSGPLSPFRRALPPFSRGLAETLSQTLSIHTGAHCRTARKSAARGPSMKWPGAVRLPATSMRQTIVS